MNKGSLFLDDSSKAALFQGKARNFDDKIIKNQNQNAQQKLFLVSLLIHNHRLYSKRKFPVTVALISSSIFLFFWGGSGGDSAISPRTSQEEAEF